MNLSEISIFFEYTRRSGDFRFCCYLRLDNFVVQIISLRYDFKKETASLKFVFKFIRSFIDLTFTVWGGYD